MKIWARDIDLDLLNQMLENTMVRHLGIEMIEVGDDYIKATMPVDGRTVQPARLLHGGASVVLAESLGSIAAVFCIADWSKYTVVGVSINANHLRSATSGLVTGIVTPVKLGRNISVWRIIINREDGKQICESRLTTTVVPI